MAEGFFQRTLLKRKSVNDDGTPNDAGGTDNVTAAPLGGTREEAIQRLQIGITGIVAMVLLIALAEVISDRADQSEASAVPEAAATVEPGPAPAVQNDPLAEAGVVPDLPASPASAPAQEPGIELEPANPVAEE